MKIKVLCLLGVLILLLPVFAYTQGWDRMCGMAVVIVNNTEFYLMPANVSFRGQDLDLVLYGWLGSARLSSGYETVKTTYHGAPPGWRSPYFCVQFISTGITVAITASDEIWRDRCRKLGGTTETATYKIDIVNNGESTVITLERSPTD